jgi:uncharacterized protein
VRTAEQTRSVLNSFLLDGMLGSLARWLRIAGYDSVYYPGKDDDALIQESKDSQRILLSQDKLLIQRANKKGVNAILVSSEDTSEQLTQIKTNLSLNLVPIMSRCPVCNGELSQRTKEEMQDNVPEASLNTFDEFWGCVVCEKVYWKGSHWGKILETLESS